MATAIECDRCGKLEGAWDVEDADLLLSRYDAERHIQTEYLSGTFSATEKRFDLCADCHESLQRWWHRPEEVG